jgi:DNA-binding transcriptional LysR family regulator
MQQDHLRTFLAVVRRMNFTRAAGDVHLSQPAVSRRIHQLERELGVVLFEQVGRTVRLTDAGRVLAGEADRILGDLERLKEAIAGFRSADRGSLRIGASSTPGLYVVPHVLGPYCRDYPAVELSYRVENSSQVEQLLIRNEIDLGFVGARRLGDELVCELTQPDVIACVVGRAHPLARLAEVPAAALGAYPWILREPGSATRGLVDEWAAQKRLRPARIIELRYPEAIRELVRAGVGVGFASELGIAPAVRAGDLARITVKGMALKRNLSLVRHKDKRPTPVMATFVNCARSALRG